MTGASQPEALVAALSSLADPTRLRLLRLLERSELGVADLVATLRLPQSTVSRHLKVLSEQGWLRSRAVGTQRIYRMPPSEHQAGRRLWALSKEQTDGWATAREDRLRLARRRDGRSTGALAFFAGAAGRWDRLRAELYGTAFNDAALLSLLPSHWLVADLGCGSGLVTARLAPYVRRVIGVDQSLAMLKAARRRTAGLDNVELRQGSLEALPLEDASADAALLVLALSYVREPRRVIEEMARVLRPGGRGIVVDLLRHDREEFRRQLGQTSLGFEGEELAVLLSEAGLRDVAWRPLAPEAEAKGPPLLLAAGALGGQLVDMGQRREERQEREAKR